MSDSPELVVVIPVYNEASVIPVVLNDWAQTLERLSINYEIHAYNDGSTDDSLNAILEEADKNKRIVVHDKKNSGHGPTILKGYLENADVPWIFQVDSDNEMKPEHFKRFWERREDFDFLIAIRKREDQHFARRIISAFSRISVSLFYGSRVIDVNAPYRLMRTERFKRFYELIPQNTFAPNVLLSGMVSLNKMRVYQAEVPYEFRQTGEVSIKKFKLLKVAIKSFIQTFSFRLSII